MYNNFIKSLLAFVPLSTMAAARFIPAKEQPKIYREVNAEVLNKMSDDHESFEMSSTETLVLIFNYDFYESWQLIPFLGAPYSVKEGEPMCTTSDCSLQWEISYSSTNNYRSRTAANTWLNFSDEDDHPVSVGLRILTPQRH